MRAGAEGRSSTGPLRAAGTGAAEGGGGRRARGFSRSQIEVGSVPTRRLPRVGWRFSIGVPRQAVRGIIPAVTGRPTPSVEEIRELVRRVVAEVLAGDLTFPVVAPPSVSTEPAVATVGAPAVGNGAGRTIALGADHGGFELKEKLAARLGEKGYVVEDCGTYSAESVDYPDFAVRVAELVASGRCAWGIMIDGAGIGSAMVANKVPGVRAALCYDVSTARNSREHNHANVLTLGAGLIGENLAWQIVEAWLETPWGGGRHAARVAKIDEIERRQPVARAAS
jgi:ribose 5-phosphate isomerase B